MASGPCTVRVAVALVGLLTVAACTTTSGVAAGPARTNGASTSAPSTSAAASTTPASTTPPTTVAPTTIPLPADQDPIHPDPNRPAQPYDRILAAELTDIESFWQATFPTVYGKPFTDLTGGIWAVYRGAQGVPGCGEPQTTYRDIRGNAFYCSAGDFLAFDDQELFPQIYQQYGPFLLGMVLAHEIGHAVQARAGLTRAPTIVLEQQADCFAGAWMGHVGRGGSPYLRFTDADLNAAFAGMLTFSDAPGTTPGQRQAHGSGFDRVGAFQDGFSNGAAACATYPQSPPPVIELPLTTQDAQNGGNMALADLFPAVTADLDRYWGEVFAQRNAAYAAPAGGAAPYTAAAGADCGAGPVPAESVVDCPARDAVVYDRDFVDGPLYDIGDYAVGLLVADAWSAAMQRHLDVPLTGVPRSLQADCMTGAWTGNVLGSADQNRHFYLSAGDLDEGLTALLHYGGADPARTGSVFDRIASYRKGLLQGIGACDL